MHFIKDYIFEIYHLLLEMAPYLLLGFLIAGILKFTLKPATMKKHLGEANLRSVVNASLLGVPMPLCSCGVIPTGVGLYRNGASKGAAQSFLISTPQTGVDSIMITYSLLGLPFAIIRPIAAFLTGIAGGLITNKVEGEKPHKFANGTGEEDMPKGWRKIPAILKYAFVDFMADIAKWLAIGILVAGLIAVVLPDDFFLKYLSNPYLSMAVMLVASIPLYVCATSSVPIAAALILKGLSPGAALVFLMAGPATNAATISVIGKTLGKKSLIVYLGTIIVGSFAGGIVLDQFFPASWFTGIMAMGQHDHSMLPEWLMIASAVVLTGLILYTLMVKMIRKIKGNNESCESCEVTLMHEKTNHLVHIEGMTCQHCVMNVKKGLSSLDGVTEVVVNLEAKSARVIGKVDAEKIKEVISELGYTVKGIE
ncbi:MAG: permease [Candidatus Marinimicrobia bacterium]|nr:permease [Candidatus Neomarinimicrobiota bacterium]